MDVISDIRLRRSRNQGLKTDVLTANGDSKGLVKDEADKVTDLLGILVSGSIIIVLLFALLNW